jgi:hypothetical protein
MVIKDRNRLNFQLDEKLDSRGRLRLKPGNENMNSWADLYEQWTEKKIHSI